METKSFFYPLNRRFSASLQDALFFRPFFETVSHGEITVPSGRDNETAERDWNFTVCAQRIFKSNHGHAHQATTVFKSRSLYSSCLLSSQRYNCRFF
jgi:hypothetical protein